ncbi:MAG: universal stress protein [Thermodesulfobacteriota bacterium]
MNAQTFGDLSRRDVERHLLVAVDESDHSKRTVMYLADFFGGLADVYITLLTIIPEPSEDFFPTEAARAKRLREKRAEMEQAMADYRAILRAVGFREDQVESRIVIRPCVSIGAAILEEQEKLRCCIVVVGRRGISHSEEFVFGSTSNHILHHASNFAVLVVE